MVTKLKNILIKKWQLLTLISMISILLVISGYSYYRYEKRSIEKDKYNELKVIAELKINEIVRWRKERLADANIISHRVFFQRAVEQYSFQKKDTLLEADIIEQMNFLKTHYGYENIIITSTDGEVIIYSNKDTLSLNRITLMNIKKATRLNQVIFTDFYIDTHQRIRLDVITPLFNKKKQSFAFVILQIDPSHYLFPLIQEWPTPSKSAETVLLRRENDEILFLNELRHIKKSALNLRIPITSKEVPGVQVAIGMTGITEGFDYRHEKVIAYIRPVPDSPWYMVSKVDKNEIFAELNYRTIIIIAFVTLLILLSGIGLTWIYHYRQINIYKSLYLAEKTLTDTEDEYRAILYNIADAVITTDSKGHIKNMNHVAEKLTGWKETKASEKSLDEIFNLVDEKNLTPVSNIVEKVLNEEITANISDHSLLISKDGIKLPVISSVTTIKNNKGEINRVVIVFKDQTEERAKQKELIESEKRFRSTLDNMLEGCQIIGSDWKYLYLNDVADKHNRRPKETLLGKKYTDMWPGIEDTEVFRRLRYCLEEKIPQHMENEFVFPDGTTGWFDLSIQPIPEGVFILSIDITESKKAAESLYYHQELIKEMGRVAKIGGWEFDPVSGKGTWTEETARIHDLNPNNPTNADIGLSFYKDESLIKINTAIKEAVAFGKPYNLELEMTTAKGIHKWVQTIGHPIIEKGKVIRLRGSFQDITEQKQSENNERLAHEILNILNRNEDSETMIGAIIRTIKKNTGFDAIGIRLKEGDDFPYFKTEGFDEDFVEAERYLCDYDPDGNIVRDESGDPLLECMCGNILCGRADSSKSFFTEGGSFRSNNTTQLLATTSPADRLARTRNRCNSEGYESVALVPIRSGKDIIGLLQMNDHRTDMFTPGMIPFFEGLAANLGIALMRNKAKEEIRKINSELEHRVEERTAQLEQVNKELEAFSYSVSHDLRAPLRYIGGFTDLLTKDYLENLPDKAQHYLNTIKQSAQQMGSLIDDLLQFSKTGRTELRKRDFDMGLLLDEVLEQAKTQVQDRHIDWKIDHLPVVNADHSLIRQVWSNLVDNALKYSKNKNRTIIEIGCSEKKDEYIFFIKDNGVGFDMKYAHKLFGVFQRLHSVSEFEGTGIGLANVRRIISRHNGSTWAESKPDKGTVFYFSIPK